MTDSESLAKTDLASCLEAVLFVASGPVSVAQLAATLAVSTQDIENALALLGERCDRLGGLSLQWHAGKVQLTTSAQMGLFIEKFPGTRNLTRISKAALETLAIVCYQQPATRPQIDLIRGVSSDGVIKSLLSKGLIQKLDELRDRAAQLCMPQRLIFYKTLG